MWAGRDDGELEGRGVIGERIEKTTWVGLGWRLQRASTGGRMARATCSREKAAEPSVCVCVLVCYSVYVYMPWCPVVTHCCVYLMHVFICMLVDMSCVC